MIIKIHSSLKIETFGDITRLKKVKFSWQLSHLIRPKAENEKHLANADELSFIPVYALGNCTSHLSYAHSSMTCKSNLSEGNSVADSTLKSLMCELDVTCL